MPIVTIYRGVFTAGEEIANGVARALGYRCVSRERAPHLGHVRPIDGITCARFSAHRRRLADLEVHDVREQVLAALSFDQSSSFYRDGLQRA
jgi:hypothetical protein